MTVRGLIEARWVIVWTAVALVIAYCVVLTRVNTDWFDRTTLEIATAFSLAALLGYPLVLATAYTGSFVKGEAGTWVAIGLYFFGAFWAVAAIVILLLGVLVSTGIFLRAFSLGSAAVLAVMLVTGAWAIRGGSAARLWSRIVLEGLGLATAILGLWWQIRETAGTRWTGESFKLGVFYVVLVALLALSVAAVVQLILDRLEHRAHSRSTQIVTGS